MENLEEEKYCDLHTHSVYSDGTATPQELVAEAEKLGLAAVALTDHNTTAGLPEFLREAENKTVKAVAGVEFSTDYGDGELHILGLFLKPEHFEKIEARLEILRKNKEESNAKLVENLNRGGYAIDLAAIKAQTPNGHINRAHIATALLEKGYVKTVREAFETVLKKDGGFYVQAKRLDALDTVAFIKELGGVAVLAHPLLELSEAELRGFLEQAKPYGLDGMETSYSTYDQAQTELCERVAAEYGLLRSGGSDFHGLRKPDIGLGVGRGGLKVPIAYFEKLFDRSLGR